MIEILFLLIGLIVLAKSASWFIDGATLIGRLTGLSDVFIGLTVFAIGTSLPELAVNVTASLNGLHELPLGNVLGSNIANLLFVLGVAAIIRTVPVRWETVRIGLPLNLLAILLVAVLAHERFGIFRSTVGLSRLDGVILLAGFPVYAYFALSLAHHAPPGGRTVGRRRLLLAVLATATALIGLIVSAQWIVRGATSIVTLFGLSEHIVGLSIVALGTSLPELATTVAALLKRQHELVVGNIIGSNLVNVFFVLGISATMNPLPVSPSQFIDIAAVALATAFVWFLLSVRKKPALTRQFGIFFVALYGLYQLWRIRG
ncbi:calcium/sodium antiporter [Candidatus Uhrbacteria bacterium]|nr:calcium/sodium antiporter [Candidatus Uhrbacteria bacterium]